MINRTVVGFVIPAVGVVATLTDKSETGFKFAASNWLIPIVLFGFLFVIVLDNIILSVAYLGDKHRRRSNRWSGGTYVRSPDADDDDDDHEKLVDDTKRVSSIYSRDVAYQPYDAYAAQAVASGSQKSTPELGGGSRALSRAPSPQPAQIPVSVIMQNNFRPSHARTRSAGYAAVGHDEHEDYNDVGHGFVAGGAQPGADSRV
jgi:hypothetical protein